MGAVWSTPGEQPNAKTQKMLAQAAAMDGAGTIGAGAGMSGGRFLVPGTGGSETKEKKTNLARQKEERAEFLCLTRNEILFA